jgi:hypothetical protein
MNKTDKTKHTPGPWAADPIYLGDSPKICAHRLFRPDAGGSFAVIENQNVTGKRLLNEEAAANARLIAAAPKMLATINEVIRRMADYHQDYREGQKKHKTYSRNDSLVLSSISSLVNARDQATRE